MRQARDRQAGAALGRQAGASANGKNLAGPLAAEHARPLLQYEPSLHAAAPAEYRWLARCARAPLPSSTQLLLSCSSCKGGYSSGISLPALQGRALRWHTPWACPSCCPLRWRARGRGAAGRSARRAPAARGRARRASRCGSSCVTIPASERGGYSGPSSKLWAGLLACPARGQTGAAAAWAWVSN